MSVCEIHNTKIGLQASFLNKVDFIHCRHVGCVIFTQYLRIMLSLRTPTKYLLYVSFNLQLFPRTY